MFLLLCCCVLYCEFILLFSLFHFVFALAVCFFFRSRSLSPIYSFAKRQNLSIKRYMFINRMRGKKKHFIRLLNGKSANKAGKAKLLVQ